MSDDIRINALERRITSLEGEVRNKKSALAHAENVREQLGQQLARQDERIRNLKAEAARRANEADAAPFKLNDLREELRNAKANLATVEKAKDSVRELARLRVCLYREETDNDSLRAALRLANRRMELVRTSLLARGIVMPSGAVNVGYENQAGVSNG